MRGNVLQNHARSGDFGAFADFDIAQYFRTGANQHASPHFGMSVAAFFAGSPQCHALQNGNAIVNDGSLANHYAGGVIKQYTFADFCGRVNVYTERY